MISPLQKRVQISLTFSPKTGPADKLVFWHNKNIEEELCHEEEIYRGTDCRCFKTGGAWDSGGRSYQEDGDHGADLLPLEEEVWWFGHERVETFEAVGRGKPEVEADGGGLEP